MARLTLRRLALLALTAGPLGAVVLAALVAVGALSVTAALLVAYGVVIFCSLGILGIGLRRIDRRVDGRLQEGLRENRKQIERILVQSQKLARSVDAFAVQFQETRGAASEDRVEVLSKLAETSTRFDHMSEGLVRLHDAVGDLPTRLAGPVSEALNTTKAIQGRLSNRLYAKVEAQWDLRSLVVPRAPMPLLGGWALDADILHMIVMSLWERRPELVVECGSGSSSVWIGYILERLGKGRLVSLEHDERFHQASKDLILAHNLETTVEIRYAPLEPWSEEVGGQEYLWYDVSALKDLNGIGLMLVDGPPAASGDHVRYPAGPILIPRCADDVVIVLDDTDRQAEKALSDRWLTAFPGLERTLHAHGSAHVFQRASTAADS